MSTYKDSEGLDLMYGNQLVHPPYLIRAFLVCPQNHAVDYQKRANALIRLHEQYDLNLHMLEDIYSLSATKMLNYLYKYYLRLLMTVALIVVVVVVWHTMLLTTTSVVSAATMSSHDSVVLSKITESNKSVEQSFYC